MTDEINPGNYVGANITIVGYAGGKAEFPAYDKDGTKGVLELNVGVGQGYKTEAGWKDTGTTWYSVSAASEWADQLRAVGKGDKVRVDNGRLETREFKRKDGSVGQQFSIRFGSLTILESKGDASAAPAAGGFSDDTPF